MTTEESISVKLPQITIDNEPKSHNQISNA